MALEDIVVLGDCQNAICRANAQVTHANEVSTQSDQRNLHEFIPFNCSSTFSPENGAIEYGLAILYGQSIFKMSQPEVIRCSLLIPMRLNC